MTWPQWWQHHVRRVEIDGEILGDRASPPRIAVAASSARIVEPDLAVVARAAHRTGRDRHRRLAALDDRGPVDRGAGRERRPSRRPAWSRARRPTPRHAPRAASDVAALRRPRPAPAGDAPGSDDVRRCGPQAREAVAAPHRGHPRPSRGLGSRLDRAPCARPRCPSTSTSRRTEVGRRRRPPPRMSAMRPSGKRRERAASLATVRRQLRRRAARSSPREPNALNTGLSGNAYRAREAGFAADRRPAARPRRRSRRATSLRRGSPRSATDAPRLSGDRPRAACASMRRAASSTVDAERRRDARADRASRRFRIEALAAPEEVRRVEDAEHAAASVTVARSPPRPNAAGPGYDPALSGRRSARRRRDATRSSHRRCRPIRAPRTGSETGTPSIVGWTA